MSLLIDEPTAMATPLKPASIKVREYRKRLRSQGLRPFQVWVPDVRTAAFKAEAHRQSLLVAASSGEEDDQAFVDAISEWPDQ